MQAIARNDRPVAIVTQGGGLAENFGVEIVDDEDQVLILAAVVAVERLRDDHGEGVIAT